MSPQVLKVSDVKPGRCYRLPSRTVVEVEAVKLNELVYCVYTRGPRGKPQPGLCGLDREVTLRMEWFVRHAVAVAGGA